MFSRIDSRHFQVSLRMFLVVVAALGLILGLQGMAIRERQKVRNEIWENDGVVFAKSDVDSCGWMFLDDTYLIPLWRKCLGDESIAYIVLNDNSSLEVVNHIHLLFPEAVIEVDTDERGHIELRPGDPSVTIEPTASGS